MLNRLVIFGRANAQANAKLNEKMLLLINWSKSENNLILKFMKKVRMILLKFVVMHFYMQKKMDMIMY